MSETSFSYETPCHLEMSGYFFYTNTFAETFRWAFHECFLNVLRRHGAVLSWAPPGQRGLGHVNNRPPEYVLRVMKQRGFQLDFRTSKKLRSVAFYSWLKRNLLVFRRPPNPGSLFWSYLSRNTNTWSCAYNDLHCVGCGVKLYPLTQSWL